MLLYKPRKPIKPSKPVEPEEFLEQSTHEIVIESGQFILSDVYKKAEHLGIKKDDIKEIHFDAEYDCYDYYHEVSITFVLNNKMKVKNENYESQLKKYEEKTVKYKKSLIDHKRKLVEYEENLIAFEKQISTIEGMAKTMARNLDMEWDKASKRKKESIMELARTTYRDGDMRG